jgi:hypothetical protein
VEALMGFGLGVSPAGRVSQILTGGENLTLRTLAALSTALDARFCIELSPLKAAGHLYKPPSAGCRNGSARQSSPDVAGQAPRRIPTQVSK